MNVVEMAEGKKKKRKNEVEVIDDGNDLDNEKQLNEQPNVQFEANLVDDLSAQTGSKKKKKKKKKAKKNNEEEEEKQEIVEAPEVNYEEQE